MLVVIFNYITTPLILNAEKNKTPKEGSGQEVIFLFEQEVRMNGPVPLSPQSGDTEETWQTAPLSADGRHL